MNNPAVMVGGNAQANLMPEAVMALRAPALRWKPSAPSCAKSMGANTAAHVQLQLADLLADTAALESVIEVSFVSRARVQALRVRWLRCR